MNRLAKEKSPYLLQHAANPVEWYAWGEEAFSKARSEDKPIFLSIGYSTCHWCHVMEHESFEQDDVAALLNEHFVSIKVDREERPDVDRIYMLFVQATTGQGGWPMSVWLTPELKPFFGGTYFPPDNRYGRPGFKTVLQHLRRAWAEDRPKLETSSEEILAQLREHSALAPALIDPSVLETAYNAFRRSFDSRKGGFGSAPKFPRPSVHNFLLRYAEKMGNEDAREMVFETLRAMARGGMNDQLGGGFHRYSVDANWFVPHFEKMLYDQAQLAVTYLEAFQMAGEESFAAEARCIFEYVLRDMTHAEGGFFSAEDADSLDGDRKVEGAFYVWTAREIDQVLGPAEGALFKEHFGVEENGNVLEDPHGEFSGKNILFIARPSGDFEHAKRELLATRSRRVRPHLDDKILTAWNGLMITALARGAQVLSDQRLLAAARGAADFIRLNLWRDDTLLRRYRDGDIAIPGFLDDYAFYSNALIDLYEASFDIEYLHFAERLADRMLELFEDKVEGGFFSTAETAQNLVLRVKDDYDGAEPSGNSIAALLLLRLSAMRGREDYSAAAERTIHAFSQRLAQQAPAVPQMLVAYLYSLSKPRQVVIAGPLDDHRTHALLAAARLRFSPGQVLLHGDDVDPPMPMVDGGPAAYVCQNFICEKPVTDPGELQ